MRKREVWVTSRRIGGEGDPGDVRGWGSPGFEGKKLSVPPLSEMCGELARGNLT